jgi:small subunit ribosomal protein S6
MNTYELVLIFSSTLAQEEQKKIVAKVEKTITSEKGKIEKFEDWGKKVFLYPIKKHTNGFYFFWRFNLGCKEAGSLTKSLRLDDKILRHMIVSV